MKLFSNFKKENYSTSTFLFIKFLALIYIVAFFSIATQITGLIGSKGILPINEYLAGIKLQYGQEALLKYPTIFLINSSDMSLKLIAYGGAAFGIFLFFESFPLFFLLILWLLYLSITIAGQIFFGYQWDYLLLEAGFLAIFLAPLATKINTPFEPSKAMVIAFRILLFKLIFMSGVVKLTSGDTSWRDLTALNYHFETQPLPNPLGYKIHHLSNEIHKIMCFLMLAIELIIPFFIFFGKRLRLIAFFSITALQIVIFLTGNYNFFNLLTIIISFFLLEDSTWSSILIKFKIQKKDKKKYKVIPESLASVLVIFIIFISLAQITNFHLAQGKLPNILYKTIQYTLPFRSINTYGLFAIMTKTRPEVILEGSNDGRNWIPYEFKYKADRLDKRLPIIAPHQPRLDWQMWFLALEDYRFNIWFLNFSKRILEGEKTVLDLLAKNPFPDSPPKYLRAVLYEYKFSTVGELRSNGLRWKREFKKLYCPVLTNKN